MRPLTVLYCSMILLSFKQLLSFQEGDSVSTCGCNGTNQVYVLYKPPASGWYEHYPSKNRFQRSLSLPIYNELVEYYLFYRKRTLKWVLLENSPRKSGITKVATLGKNMDVKVQCPSIKCQCSRVKVQGGPNYVKGRYFRSDVFEKEKEIAKEFAEDEYEKKKEIAKEFAEDEYEKLNEEDNKPFFVNTSAKMRQVVSSSGLNLADLSSCIRKSTKGSGLHPDVYAAEVYIREDGQYNLTKASEGDFWWITAHDDIFAISTLGAHCIEQLPSHTQWRVIKEGQKFELQNSSNMKVYCYIYEGRGEVWKS